MREIEFRGISYETNKFVYGWLHQTKYGSTKYFIRTFPNEDDDYVDVVVDKKTIGQYTGLKDNNGVKIFDGDIVQFDGDEIGIIKYTEGCFEISADGFVETFYDNRYAYEVEVIGNIYENPELLEGEEK